MNNVIEKEGKVLEKSNKKLLSNDSGKFLKGGLKTKSSINVFS